MANRIPAKIRKKVMERADYKCEICGNTKGLEMHHIIKRRKKIHREETLILVCGPVLMPWTCHSRLERESDLGLLYKLDLQRYYRNELIEAKNFLEDEGFSEIGNVEKMVRDLMGGRLYSEKYGHKTPSEPLRLKYRGDDE